MRGPTNRLIAHTFLLAFVCLFVAVVPVVSQTALDTESIIELLSQATEEAAIDKMLSEHPDWGKTEIADAAFKKAQSNVSNDFPKALNYARVAHRIAKKLDDKRLVVRALYLLALGDVRSGSFAAALNKYDEGYRLAKETNDTSFAFASRIRGALLRSNFFELEAAKRDAREALEVAQAANDDRLIAFAQIVSGQVSQQEVDNVAVLKSYASARDLLERSPASKFEGAPENTLLPQIFSQRAVLLQMLLHNMGLVYATQGDFENAFDYFRQSLKHTPATKLCDLNSITLSTIGYLYQYQDNVSKAEENLGLAQGVLEGCQAPRKDEAIALLRNGQGMVALSRDNPQRALELAQESLQLASKLRLSDQITDAQNTVGRALLKLRHYNEAIKFAEAVVKLSGKTFNYRRIWESYLTLAEAQEALGNLKEAERNLEQALDVSEQARLNLVGGEQERQYFMSQNVIPYHAAIEFMVRHGRPIEAYRLAERAKSRTLLESLSGSRSGLQEFLSPAEGRKEVALKRDIRTANAQLFIESNKDKPDEQKIELLKLRANKTRRDYENFLNEAYAAHPGLRNRQGDLTQVNFEQAAGLLRKHSLAVVHYVITRSKVLVFIVRDRGESQPHVTAHTLDVTPQELSRQVIGFHTALVNRKANFDTWSRSLYDVLIRPAQRELERYQTLCIVPDGVLWKLPFPALLNDDEYLIRKHIVFFAPSLAALEAMDHEVPRPRNELLAMANPSLPVTNSSARQGFVTRSADLLRGKKLVPLPETETEAKRIAQMYGTHRSRVFLGKTARETTFKNLAGGYDVIHIAAHGFLDDSNPLYSYLVLAQGVFNKEEDGLLTAREVLSLKLNANLVVLSACDTALGDVRAGEGMIGMTWAFFVAGVPSTVASQWSVETNSTTRLMVGFHENLTLQSRKSAPVDKAEALRNAQLTLLDDERFALPYYWAGFSLVGRPW